MNMNQMINMFMRLFGRKISNIAVNKGIDMMTRGKGGVQTPAQKKQANDMRQAVKRSRQAARITRRLGK